MKFRPAIFLVMFVLAGCSGSASSDLDAAKAAAYIVFGVEDGTPFSGNTVFKQTASQPLTFTAQNDSAKMTIAVTKKDDCNYGFDLTTNKEAIKFSFDFRGLTTASIVPNEGGMGSAKSATMLPGAKMSCEGSRDQELCRVFKAMQVWPLRFTDKDPTRLPSTVNTFKADYCKPQ